jgi:kynureninase
MNAVLASLEVFSKATMPAIRKKSIELTAYLERLLLSYPVNEEGKRPFSLITPSDSAQRGAQLSVLLVPGILEGVFRRLQSHGVILDERKPDVIRVAPAPLYNSFTDVWEFVQVFFDACREEMKAKEVVVPAVAA